MITEKKIHIYYRLHRILKYARRVLKRIPLKENNVCVTTGYVGQYIFSLVAKTSQLFLWISIYSSEMKIRFL